MNEIYLGLRVVEWLVLASAVISLSGGAAYLRDMFRGTSKPNLVSWGLWALAPLIATGAAISSGADWWGTARVFFSGFVPFAIFVVGLFLPQSYWKLTRFDLWCGALSLVALGAWLIAGQPVLAILLAVAADLLACVPTLAKAWKSPQTETALTFFLGFLSSLITIPAVPVWTIENIAFQGYLLLINIVLFGTILYGKATRPKAA